ncbi:MAG TPA: CPBP family intramembrane glutamic endopeptidase [bacterium]|nr:CPBP family intramembrane glutamic endopeptidase [bacterium]
MKLLVLISVVVAAIVFADARPRVGTVPAALWAAASLLASALVAPLYLLTRPSRAQAWGLLEVLALTLFFATTVPLAAAWIHIPAGVAPPLGIIAVLAVIQNAVFAAAAVYVVHVKYRLPLAAVGLTVGAWEQRIRQGAIAAAAGIVGNSAGQNATLLALGAWMGRAAANDLVMREEARAPVYRLLPRLHQPVEIAVIAVLVGVVVPIGEEIFFRGLVFGALRRRMNLHTAVLLSALFFSAAHLEPIEFLPIMLLGVVLAYAYDRTGSLVPGMIAHGVNNLAALFFFYYQGLPPSPP